MKEEEEEKLEASVLHYDFIICLNNGHRITFSAQFSNTALAHLPDNLSTRRIPLALLSLSCKSAGGGENAVVEYANL